MLFAGRDGCALQDTGRFTEGETQTGADDARSGKGKGTTPIYISHLTDRDLADVGEMFVVKQI